MLRTNVYLPSIFLFCLILNTPAFCQEDLSSPTQNQSEKTEAVNQQLDRVENSQANAEPSRKFYTMQPDAEKEFPHLQPDAQKGSSNLQVERPSARGMLKDTLNPDFIPAPSKPKDPSNVQIRIHTFDVGAEDFYYRYQEPSPVGVMTQGNMYGYYANYAYRPAKPNVFNNALTNVYFLQARYASSRDLEYSGDGSLKKHDEAMEFRGLIGKDYYIGTDSMVTPYFGFGYRYLIDHGNGQHNIVSNRLTYAYDRKSHYYYLPMGANAVIDMPGNWEIDPNIEYDILLQGWQKSYLSDGDQFTGYNNPDIVNRQDHGYGVRGSIKFLKHGSAVDFYVEPYIRYWHIEQSKLEFAVIDGTAGLGGEPDNNTVEVGSKFGIQF